ncbi:MAG: ABC transporter permease, partial [Actinomycetia bacterium]|nr:ABC transporter permease [Actinomycetes bacterium]
MTTSEGAVYDLGYQPFEGEHRGRKGAWITVWAEGLRRILGIRRKARRKIMPWLLVAIALIPSIIGVGVAFILPAPVAEGVDLASQNADFFALGGTIAMLFTALAAPELLIPDRRDGVLSMLSSRPLTSTDYLTARFASLLTVVGAFLLLPQAVLFAGQVGTDPEGLAKGIVNAADTLPKILVVAAIYVIAYVPLGFAVASLSNRKAIAASVYLAGMIALTAFAEVIVRNAVFDGARWFALIAPINT